MEQLLTQLDAYIVQALIIIAALSALSAALWPLVKWTKTKKDDEALSKFDALLEKVKSFIGSSRPKK